MKFLFTSYTRSAEFNQPAEWIKRICAYLGVLESLSKQHTVTSIEQINYQGNYQHNGVQYYFMDFGKRVLHFPWKLHRFIKKQSPDIILVHGMDFPLQIIQLRLKMGSRVKIIVQSHGNKMPKGYKKIVQQMADTCINAYFFTSKAMSEPWLKEKLIADEKKIHEIMVGSSIFYPVNKQTTGFKKNTKDGPVFLWAGRLDKNKDPVTVVNAFFRFLPGCPQATLYMIYQTGELLKEIEMLLKESNFKNNIILLGKILHEDMLHWFNRSDFFISGSHFEVFGAAVVEAMSCGCIPIITDIPSFQKITGNACGLLYKAGDERELVNTLQQAVNMDLQKEREKVFHQFQQHLSFDAIAEKIQETAISL